MADEIEPVAPSATLLPHPTITVVVPSRNDARMLEVCLRMLAVQSRVADEIIVVDNGSSDDTAQVARAAGATLVIEDRTGVWPASAAGFDRASGELIARLDADSRPPVDWIERVESAFLADSTLDILTGPGEFYETSKLAATFGRRLYLGGYFWAIGLWLGHPPVFGSNFAMRRHTWKQLHDRVHRDRSDVHDDLDLSLHLTPGTHVRYDAALIVGVSARPFTSGQALGLRLRLAYRTLRIHWPEDAPWRRRARFRRDRGR